MSPILALLQEKFGEFITEGNRLLEEDTIVISPLGLLPVALFLKQETTLHFEMLVDLTVVDLYPQEPRFEVVYHLLSLQHQHRLRIKIRVAEGKPQVPTLTSLWPGANWLEREAWDMFGIVFEGHPNLQRILMYREFEGHPLRKDYPFRKRQPLIP